MPEASLLVARINVYEMHTNSTTQRLEMWCSDSVAPERYRSSEGRYTMYDGVFSKQDDLAGRGDDPLFLVWRQHDAFALGRLILRRQFCNSFADGCAHPFDALGCSTYSTRIDECTLEVVK